MNIKNSIFLLPFMMVVETQASILLLNNVQNLIQVMHIRQQYKNNMNICS